MYVYMVFYSLFPLPKKVSKIKGRVEPDSYRRIQPICKSSLSKVPTILAPKGFASGEPNWD